MLAAGPTREVPHKAFLITYRLAEHIFFFFKVLPIWDIHLAIPYVRISKSISCQDSPQSRDAHFVLESWVFWKGAVQVPLNLLRGEVVLPHGLLHEVLIVAGVSGLLVDGTWETRNGPSIRSGSPGLGCLTRRLHVPPVRTCVWQPQPAVTALPGPPSSRSTGSRRLKNSPVRYDPLEKRMATHSSILAWRVPWMEEPAELQSMGSRRVEHD